VVKLLGLGLGLGRPFLVEKLKVGLNRREPLGGFYPLKNSLLRQGRAYNLNEPHAEKNYVLLWPVRWVGRFLGCGKQGNALLECEKTKVKLNREQWILLAKKLKPGCGVGYNKNVQDVVGKRASA
jgi:hypothetical protein